MVPTTVKYYGGKSASRIAANPLYRIVVNVVFERNAKRRLATLAADRHTQVTPS